MSTIDHIPPQDLDAEQATLGSMLLESKALFTGLAVLKSGDFYRPVHSEIYLALADIAQRNEPADPIVLRDELVRRKKLDDIGGMEYIFALVDKVPTAANIEHYAKIVLDKSQRRRLIAAAAQITAWAHDDDVENPADKAMSEVLAATGTKKSRMRNVNEVLDSVWSRIQDYEAGVVEPGVPWKLSDMEKTANGVRRHELVVIAGESGFGKTVMKAEVMHQCAKFDIPCLFIACEMEAEDVMTRALCALASVDSMDLRKGRVNIAETSLTRAVDHYYGKAIDIYDATPTLTELQAICHRWVAERSIKSNGCGIVIVDYLQRVAYDGRLTSSVEIDTAIVKTFKNTARDLPIAVVTGSQYSKHGEGKAKRENVRGSAMIYGEADKLILLNALGDPDGYGRVQMEIEINKHRNGSTGKVEAVFDRQFTRFVAREPRFDD